ncbi:uncharacterized protein M421DRAFT_375653 [Didymella exigua CBS 183.55]|uniref:Uncharacterized protein n=1 Tax=Didymella exigua CBS 183.55 TaxID=1150837 RepID=A0A6A5RSS2_9PLEO|nr:uncharacterized protein M421DRAFT_375653 [Didymella exigua CBS 183.55]KAF1930503.1 hypothetical protein M421DRAFT_375653 [Didymella exigua CBS 183.55]
MMAHGYVLPAAGQIETRGFVTGQIRCVCRAWCHARRLPGLGLRSECTTVSVCAVDHHGIEVGRSPVGASVDQVQGIQKGQVCRQANEWAQRRSIRRVDDWDALRLISQVPAGIAARLVVLE